MEHQKILNLLNEANYSKFETKKWNIIKKLIMIQQMKSPIMQKF